MDVVNFKITFKNDGQKITADVTRFPVGKAHLNRVYIGAGKGDILHFWQTEANPFFYFDRGTFENARAEEIKKALIKESKKLGYV